MIYGNFKEICSQRLTHPRRDASLLVRRPPPPDVALAATHRLQPPASATLRKVSGQYSTGVRSSSGMEFVAVKRLASSICERSWSSQWLFCRACTLCPSGWRLSRSGLCVITPCEYLIATWPLADLVFVRPLFSDLLPKLRVRNKLRRRSLK